MLTAVLNVNPDDWLDMNIIVYPIHEPQTLSLFRAKPGLLLEILCDIYRVCSAKS